MSQAEQLACVNQRKFRRTNPFTTVLTDENLKLLQDKGELTEDDVGVFAKGVADELAMKKLAASTTKLKDGCRPCPVAGIGYLHTVSALDKEKILIEARALLPRHRESVNIFVHKDTSWQVKTPYKKEKPKSKSVKFDDWKEHRWALLEVLQWSWDLELEFEDAQECPFDLFAELDLEGKSK